MERHEHDEAGRRVRAPGSRASRAWEIVACVALVLVIVGLLLATWMPAIVAARRGG